MRTIIRIPILTVIIALAASQIVLALAVFTMRVTDHELIVVKGGSMEPTYQVGDAVIMKTLTGTPKAGQIITYTVSHDKLVTHRVVKPHTIDGQPYLQTKGDANPAPDPDFVPLANVLGTPQIAIPQGGYAINFLTSPVGRLVTYGPALLLILITEGRIIRHRLKQRKAEREELAAYDAYFAGQGEAAAVPVTTTVIPEPSPAPVPAPVITAATNGTPFATETVFDDEEPDYSAFEFGSELDTDPETAAASNPADPDAVPAAPVASAQEPVSPPVPAAATADPDNPFGYADDEATDPAPAPAPVRALPLTPPTSPAPGLPTRRPDLAPTGTD